MENEIWKPIKYMESFYEISNLGRIKRLSTVVNCRSYKKRRTNEKILKLCINSNGYYAGCLSIKNRRINCRLHRLLALHFIPNPENKPEVNHKDGNKLNNSLDNLEWVTHQENGMHAYANGLNSSPKGSANPLSKSINQLTLNGELIANYGSIHEAARETGVHRNNIGYNLYGKTKQAGGFKWQYA